jgi:hypothetical protein
MKTRATTPSPEVQVCPELHYQIARVLNRSAQILFYCLCCHELLYRRPALPRATPPRQRWCWEFVHQVGERLVLATLHATRVSSFMPLTPFLFWTLSVPFVINAVNFNILLHRYLKGNFGFSSLGFLKVQHFYRFFCEFIIYFIIFPTGLFEE